MAILGIGRDEFEEFKVDIHGKLASLSELAQGKIQELERAIQHKATDSEIEAKTAAERTAALEIESQRLVKNITSALGEIDTYKTLASEEASEITALRNTLTTDSAILQKIISELKSQHEEISKSKIGIDAAITGAHNNIATLEKLLAKQEVLSGQIDAISELSAKATTLYKDLTVLQENSLKRRSAIEELYLEIFGREVKAEDGTAQLEPGLRDMLEKSYDELAGKINNLDQDTSKEVKRISDDYITQLGDQKNTFDTLISNSTARIKSVDDELKALLPGSMAAGLSAAYEAKTTEEVKAQDKYALSFRNSIYAMILISLIPFSIDAYLLIERGMDILQIISGTPNLILSILPIYIPVLWFAYSSNKKLNLSKRLIEEYTHKAVLGKTFSGLSNQIDNLPHEAAVKEELRTRLLFNILQVSAENPGKLITDYNKTDHPFMEALEKSAKLSEAVESLSKLPGFSAMAEKLASRSQKILSEQTHKVEQGLAIQDDLASPSSQSTG